ncbi:hypothetical protein Mth01_04050 [Sphaerimonospora thailandensis]|uniref:Uncharacterized protein n=2 Tax=Sphaerimonospora thailandensis TaxID=795644 RepID=A0A8J3R317_9ACTN|nr:hypothetical protein Mth01_04050 [Sphaerimonospora thailandensis]
MYGLDGTYNSAVAFILGYDCGNGSLFLAGFREWLVVKYGEGDNLGWPTLVKLLAHVDGQGLLYDAGVDALVVDTLFQLLDEFLEQRDEYGGLVKIFDRYLAWLKSQEWFRSETLE